MRGIALCWRTQARALPFIILILKLCAGPYPADFAARPGTGANLLLRDDLSKTGPSRQPWFLFSLSWLAGWLFWLACFSA